MNENFIYLNERSYVTDATSGELPPTSARANYNALDNILFCHKRPKADLRTQAH
jgi:hypothetical protein